MYKILFFLALPIGLFAQVAPGDTDVIRTVLHKTGYNKIVYSDKSPFIGGWLKLKDPLKNRMFIRNSNSLPCDTLFLSRGERSYLLKKIKLYQNFSWDDSLFAYSKRIERDSVKSYLIKQERCIYAKTVYALSTHDTTTYYQYLHRQSWVSSFSKPIYIRHGTICLISYISMCCHFNGGYNGTYFCKKVNGKWVKWITLEEGAY